MFSYLKKPATWLQICVLIFVGYQLLKSGAADHFLSQALPPIVDETQTIKEDQYYQYRIELTRRADLSIDFDHLFGIGVDVYTLDRENYALFQRWIGGERNISINYISQLSRPNIDQDFTVNWPLDAGVYYVVIDNSDFGDAKTIMNFASDDVQFHITIR